jgi:hypothetical protein
MLGFAVVVAGLTLAWSRPVRAAETIALAPLELAGGLEVNRADLEAAMVKGLAVAGRRVVMPAEPDQRGATYAVSARISRVDATFEVRMVLQRTSDGQALNRQENHCDVSDCSVAELARRSARELVRQTLGRAGEAPPPAPATAAAVEAPLRPSKSSPTTWGVISAGVGAAAIGAGIYLLAIDSHCTSTEPNRTCKNLYDTKVAGIASLAGGAAVGALGIYLLVHDGKSEGTSVAVGVRRAGLVVAGRF